MSYGDSHRGAELAASTLGRDPEETCEGWPTWADQRRGDAARKPQAPSLFRQLSWAWPPWEAEIYPSGSISSRGWTGSCRGFQDVGSMRV